MPQNKKNVVTEILSFDFELFIGGRFLNMVENSLVNVNDYPLSSFLYRRLGAYHDCRWIFHAARGFFCHNCSHFEFSHTIRKANIADEPVLFHIIPDCLSRLPTTCLHAPSTAPEPIS